MLRIGGGLLLAPQIASLAGIASTDRGFADLRMRNRRLEVLVVDLGPVEVGHREIADILVEQQQAEGSVVFEYAEETAGILFK